MTLYELGELLDWLDNHPPGSNPCHLFTCPTCYAVSGEFCRTLEDGRQRATHAPRYVLGRQALRLLEGRRRCLATSTR